MLYFLIADLSHLFADLFDAAVQMSANRTPRIAFNASSPEYRGNPAAFFTVPSPFGVLRVKFAGVPGNTIDHVWQIHPQFFEAGDARSFGPGAAALRGIEAVFADGERLGTDLGRLRRCDGFRPLCSPRADSVVRM